MMNRQRLWLLTAIVALGAAGTTLPAGAQNSVASTSQPSLALAAEVFDSVDMITADDVWAVGFRASDKPLLRHWDGAEWSTFSGHSKVRGLLDVDHVSSSDVWASGDDGILHWDGSTWTRSYNAPGHWTEIHAVAAVSDDDVWGVGSGLGGSSVTVHWDGSTWTEVGESEPLTQFTAVDADRADNVWAVGYSGVVERWNGLVWSRFPQQDLSAHAVAVLSPDDVWIAGGYAPEAGMLHWDGHDLLRVDVPTPGVHSSLNSISAVSADDIWAVGVVTIAGGRTRSLIEHWDGRHWHVRPAPELPYSNGLFGVSAVATDDAYAVGYLRQPHVPGASLTLHWTGDAWTRVP